MKSIPLIDPIFMSGVTYPDQDNLLQHWHDRRFGFSESDRVYFKDNSVKGESFRPYQPGRCYVGDGATSFTINGTVVSNDGTANLVGQFGNIVIPLDQTAWNIRTSSGRLYKCDEGSGTTVYDSSGNGNHGTVSGIHGGFHGLQNEYSFQNEVGYTGDNVPYIPRNEANPTKDVLGADLQFSGKAQGYGVLENLPCLTGDRAAWVDFGTSQPELQNFQIDFSFNFDLLTSFYLFGYRFDIGTNKSGILIFNTTTQIYVRFYDTTDSPRQVLLDVPFVVGTTYHVTAKREAGILSIAVDGFGEGTVSAVQTIGYEVNAKTTLLDGLTNGSVTSPLDGSVWDLKVIDLDSAPENNVVMDCPCSENGGSVIYDKSVNGYAGVLQNYNLGTIWADKQPKFAHNQLNGFSRRLSLNGVDSSIDLTEPPTSQGAIEFYMHSTDYEVDSTIGIFSCVGTGVDERFHIQITARNLQLVFGDVVGSSTYTLTNGQEYKVRVEWNGSTNTAAVYVNDVLEINYNWVGNLPSDNAISIGCWKTSANAKFYFFLGLIWDVKFYDAPTGGNLSRHWPINDLWNNNANRVREYDGTTNRDDHPDPTDLKLADQEWFAVSLEILDLTINRYLVGYPVFNFRQWGVYYFTPSLRWFVSNDGGGIANGQAVETSLGQTHFGMIGHFDADETLISQWLGNIKAVTTSRPIFQQNTNPFGFGATAAGSPCRVRAAFYGKAPGGISAQFDEIFAALSGGSNFSIHPAELTQQMISDYGIQHAWSFNENGDLYDWVGSTNLVQFGTPGTLIPSGIVKEVNGYNGKIEGNPNWIDFPSENPELQPGKTWLPALEETTDWVDQPNTLGDFPWAFSSGTLNWPNSYSIGNSDLGRYSNTDDQFSQIRRDKQRKFFHYRNELTGNDLSDIKKYIEKE